MATCEPVKKTKDNFSGELMIRQFLNAVIVSVHIETTHKKITVWI